MAERKRPAGDGVTEDELERRSSHVIDMTADDDEPDVNPLDDLVDLTIDEDEEDAPEFVRELSASETQDNTQVPPGCYILKTVNCPAGAISPGSRMELKDRDFLSIVMIYRNHATGACFLRGNLIRRTLASNGLLHYKANELYFYQQTASENQNPSLKECLVTRKIDEVFRKREIVITNRPFPALSWRENYEDWERSKFERQEKSRLVCRWIFNEELDPTRKKVMGGSLQSVKEEDCDDAEGARFPALQQLAAFLRKKRIAQAKSAVAYAQQVPANAPKARKPTPEVIDLTEGDDSYVESDCCQTTKKARPFAQKRSSMATTAIKSNSRTAKPASQHDLQATGVQKFAHTYADFCAGLGGTAVGARQALFKVAFMLDHWPVACQTLQLNFSEPVLLQSLFDFCARKNSERWIVDVAHVSYPCQPHSYANRYGLDDGKNPDNIAAAFATIPLLEKCRPRIVTMEQTSHIMTKHQGQFFRVIVNHLTHKDYNVRWRICRLEEYGVPQIRKRLIMIASCPGETLATFPEPTHGPGPGRQPFATINQALREFLAYRSDNSNPIMSTSMPKDGTPYNGDKPLGNVITCDGGKGNLHPEGHRTFEIRELATAFQTLPHHHKIAGGKGDIVKQIGNAVPSLFAKVLFQHISQSLKDSDKRLVAWTAASPIEMEWIAASDVECAIVLD